MRRATRWRGVDWARHAQPRRARSWPRSKSTISTSTRTVGTLSVGNRQRVEIAKALSLNARVLIMDEPTAALPEADVDAAVRDRAATCAHAASAIVYISHRMAEIFTLADRVTVLRDGEYVATKTVAQTRASPS